MEVCPEPYDSSIADRYTRLETLGAGTYGEVRKAIDKQSGKYVAIKYIRLQSKKHGLPKAVFREMESLRQLSDGLHIVQMLDIFSNDVNVCLVMEYMERDLADIIHNSKQYLPRAHLKSYYMMMLRAIEFCHSNNIIHRDIKPSNFLLSRSGVLKLGDFGLARIFLPSKTEKLSHQVSTRQYRAPELLFASTSYDFSMDIWSMAVIFVELITLQTLFPSHNDIDQMYKVFQVMGSPSPKTWPGLESLPDYAKVSFPEMEPMKLSDFMLHAHPEDVQFVEKFLQLPPMQRLSAKEGINLPYFQQYPFPATCVELQASYQVDVSLAQAYRNLFPASQTQNTKPQKTIPGNPIQSVEEFFELLRELRFENRIPKGNGRIGNLRNMNKQLQLELSHLFKRMLSRL